MDDLVQMRVLGITTNSVQQGAYALLLAEVGGDYRIPVVIGTREAQSILVSLQNIVPPVPLVHDVMIRSLEAFGVTLDEVRITAFRDGLFCSDLLMSDDDRQVNISVRTSDAIALAVRRNVRITVVREVLETTGYKSSRTTQSADASDDDKRRMRSPRLEQMAMTTLREMMQKCVESEEYERAAEIQQVMRMKEASASEGQTEEK